jgi:hypothetical protein
MDRFKVRVRALPADGLSVTGTFLARRLSNDLAGAVHPTDPREGRPTQLDSTNFTVHVAYDVAPVSVFGNYSRHNVTNDVRNVITTLPGFGGGQRFDYVSLYESDIDRGAGGLTVDVNQRVRLGTVLSAYRNRGTFGLDWEQYRLFTELLASDGYLLKLAYQYNSLDESLFTFDDYSAHMVTLSVGYRF